MERLAQCVSVGEPLRLQCVRDDGWDYGVADGEWGHAPHNISSSGHLLLHMRGERPLQCRPEGHSRRFAALGLTLTSTALGPNLAYFAMRSDCGARRLRHSVPVLPL